MDDGGRFVHPGDIALRILNFKTGYLYFTTAFQQLFAAGAISERITGLDIEGMLFNGAAHADAEGTTLELVQGQVLGFLVNALLLL